MVTKQQLLIDTLEQPFEMGQYIKFVTEFFNTINTNAHIQTNEKVWGEYREHIKSYTKIGRYIDDNNKKIDIWAVELCSEGSVERARSLQRNFVSKLLTADNSHAGIIAFYVKEAVTWRLSFVKLDREFSPKGIQIETTPAKRYSYLVGQGEKSHTAQEQLLPIFQNEKENPTLEGIEEAFSIETVTKEFFAKYREKYLQLKEYLDGNDDFVQTAEQFNFTTEQFAKKLMGQLAFLYFLQKKGWLGVSVAPKTLTEKQYKDIFFRQRGDARQVFSEHYEQQPDGSYKRGKIADLEKDKYRADLFAGCFAGIQGIYKPWGSGDKNFIRRIFENCMARTKETNFFEEYLEPLFYNALNNPRGKNCYFPAFNSKIPFLNGGLFEPLFDDWEEKHFDIPNEIFSNAHIKKKTEADGILDIFERFNFTINEDEPLEREVAVDPEMLGKIFENLLDVKDRKSKGAFYTPREIVHYMCQESIINHLVNETSVHYEDMKKFVLYGEIITSHDSSRKTKEGEQEKAIPQEVFERIEAIDKALADIRVADPAVGSGAFPLGMLNEIVKLRNNITQYMINAVPDQYPGQKDLLRINRHPYKLKWETIQNCIFAVDIEPSAVDITKLRLWLSLIVDQEIDELNEYPHALPNLDCNIMCGNSLVEEFKGIKLFDEEVLNDAQRYVKRKPYNSGSQLSLDTAKQEQELDNMFNNLFDLQNQLFGEDDPQRKHDIKKRIEDNTEAVIEYQLRYINKDEKNFATYRKAKQLGEKPYFLWKLEFARVFKEEGFDIVIGNPPYIGESGHKEIFREVAETEFGQKYYQGKMDFFYFFFHKAIEVTKERGIISFITTNYFISADGARKLRADIKENCTWKQIINFNELRIFESAKGQHNLISILEKKKHENEPIKYSISMKKGDVNTNILQKILGDLDEDTVYNTKLHNKLYGKKDIIDLSNEYDSILEKMIKEGDYYLTKNEVGNGIDILQEEVTDKHLPHLEGFKKGQGIFAIRTDELDMMNLTSKELEVIKPYYSAKQLKKYCVIENNDRWIIYTDKYVCKEIDNFPTIKEHLEQFKSIITSDNKPYGLHRAREEALFKGEKILCLRMTKRPCFTYAEIDTYVTRAYLVIKPNNSQIKMKYLTGLLNSSLVYYWLYNKGKKKGEQLQVDKTPLLEIPIKVPSITLQEEISNFVDKIIQCNQLNSMDTELNEIEEQLNKAVYKIYGLNTDEINTINKFLESK